jgi:hypothetical protein
MGALISVGMYVHDTKRDEIGCITGFIGTRVQLRPLGGRGRWEADATHLQEVGWDSFGKAVKELAATVRARGGVW